MARQSGCCSGTNGHWWGQYQVRQSTDNNRCSWNEEKDVHKTEQLLGEAINKQLVHFMATAGCEKKYIAIVSNHYHQGVPYISVVADGGWSKCSHKHSYNAKVE